MSLRLSLRLKARKRKQKLREDRRMRIDKNDPVASPENQKAMRSLIANR